MSDCLFCKIAKKEIESQVVFESKKVLAFRDINPQAPAHILVIPKKHFSSITESGKIAPELLSEIFSAINTIAKEQGIKDPGFRIVVNHGKQAGQAVAHLHFHILGGRDLNWPPG
jgi:histidine triad (HIT) family protein